MSATSFVLGQLLVAVLGMIWAWESFRGKMGAVIRLLVFVAALSFFFDFFANARGLWHLSAGWRFYLTINTLENVAFAVAMALHLLLLYQVLPRLLSRQGHKRRTNTLT